MKITSVERIAVDIPYHERVREHLQKGWKRSEGVQMEADDYISQPVHPSDLRNTVERLLRSAGDKGKPVEMQEILAQMVGALARIDKIEQALGARS